MLFSFKPDEKVVELHWQDQTQRFKDLGGRGGGGILIRFCSSHICVFWHNIGQGKQQDERAGL